MRRRRRRSPSGRTFPFRRARGVRRAPRSSRSAYSIPTATSRRPAAVEGFLEAEAVAAIFAEASAFASTYTRSVSLGSGTLAAALAFALPIVVYEDVELHEALVPGETVLTAPREPGALAEMLRDALGERGTLVGARGRQVYKAELAWPRIAASFEPLLRGTAASASPTKRK
jgi:glycosyltransferase involved in cell wall biosynthesis